ncbi:MAG: alpha/beta hydrolase, partial [Terrimesophilobacter sp.]
MRLFLRFRKARTDLLHIAADEGSGPVVILLHGIASSSVAFELLVPMLVERHRVISMDLLGFGESPSPKGARYTIEEHVAALEHTINTLGLHAGFEMVGHSMGGLIAIRYAAVNPKRVTKLVLVSPPIYVHSSAIGNRLERAAQDLHLRAYEYLRKNKKFTMRSAVQLSRLSPIKNVLEVSERNWRAFVLSLENLIESQTTISDLAEVMVPVEVIY